MIPGGAALAQEEAKHWSYEGDTGPDTWADMAADFAACGAGLEQSPVDIPATAPLNRDVVVYAYNATALVVENNGHAIQVDYGC